MKTFVNFKFWLSAFVFIFLLTGISNAAVTAKKINAVTKSLSAQMKVEMADNTATVEIVRADEMEITKTKQILFGEALLNSKTRDKKVPIYFEAIVDDTKNNVTMIDYTFVEGENQINVDFLQKLVIKKLGNDFKTKEIALAISNISQVKDIHSMEKFRGIGEVRIGSLVWKRIKFEIKFDETSENVIYKLNEM